jgi:hypothetical protein
MIPPVAINVAVAAVTRRRRQAEAEDAAPTSRRYRRSDAEIAEELRRNIEAHERAERDLGRWMLVILATAIGIALFMAWAWLRDTGRI